VETILTKLSHTGKIRGGIALSAAVVTTLNATGGIAWAQQGRRRAPSRTQAAPRNPAGRDSFYTVQSSTTEQLAAAVRNDSRLRRLYAKHFGVPESGIAEYIQNALVLYTLPEAQKVTTYGVRKNGTIYPVYQTLKKGTKVWATRSRMPILKWACSNPLTVKLPGTTFASPPRITPAVEAARRVASLGAMPVEAPEFAPVGALTVPTYAAVTGGGGGGMVPAALVRGGRAFPIAALLPLAGLGLIRRGGGDDNTTPNRPNDIITPRPPTPNAIPEPGTFAFALAALPFAGLMLRKRRTK